MDEIAKIRLGEHCELRNLYRLVILQWNDP